MNDNLILGGLIHHFSDLEVKTIADLFGDDPVLSIIEDGTQKDRTSRAKRRKTTAYKHQRLDRITAKYSDEGVTTRSPKKALRDSKPISEAFRYINSKPMSCVLADIEFHEALQEAEYEERRSQFLKAVDQWQFLEWLFSIDDLEEELIFD